MDRLLKRFMGTRPPQPASLHHMHETQEQIARGKAEVAADKKREADDTKAKGQAEQARRQKHKDTTQEELNYLWQNYAQTPSAQAMTDAYGLLVSFPIEKGDDHTNNLKKVQIEDMKKGGWVGERLQWEWYVDRWAIFKHVKTEGHFRIGGHFKIHFEDELLDRSYRKKSVSLRYYEDGHIEVIGQDIVRIATRGRREEDIAQNLDVAIGKALRRPHLD